MSSGANPFTLSESQAHLRKKERRMYYDERSQEIVRRLCQEGVVVLSIDDLTRSYIQLIVVRDV